MEDYDVFLEMQNLNTKIFVLMVEDDENYILNEIMPLNIQIIPLRFSYDLSKFSNEYIEQTKTWFTYYFNEKNSYENEMLRLKKHFVHYQRFPKIAYVPKNIEQFNILKQMLVDMDIEVINSKSDFKEKIKLIRNDN